MALKNQNHTTVGACEIDQYARSIYARHFPGVKIWENATTINPQELPEFDLLCAGFPCQAFSISGKRRGFNDTRGSLFFEIARFVREKQPSYFILENVKGLLSHDKGNTFRIILQTLDETGYDLQWQVINSKYFVPQSRERVFIIGHLRGRGKRKILPISINNSKTIGKEMNNHGQRTMIYLSQINQNMKQKIQNRDNSWTLSTSSNDFGVIEGQRIRRLTPVECERLQGFPDNWTKGISDTQRYKCIGNAVTVPVVEYILKELFD
jgi:DNA (cytosine-5)-methyltransferase 1